MLRRVILMILLALLSVQPLVFADDLPIVFSGGTSKSVVYPNMDLEKYTDPSINFYYVIYRDISTNAHIKTEEYRVADDQLMRIAYPDKSIVVINDAPLSQSEVEQYSNEYGYVATVKTKEEKYLELAQALMKDKKVTFLINVSYRLEYYLSVDERTVSLVDIITDGKVNDLKKSYFGKTDMNDIELIKTDLWSKKKIKKNIEVMVLPYSSEAYKEGLIINLNGDEKTQIMILFNNKYKSIKEQYDIQLKKYNL